MKRNFNLHLMQIKSSKIGFTLIELIIYTVIVSFVLSVMSYFAWQVFSSQSKSYSQIEILQNANFILTKLNQQIHSSTEIISIEEKVISLRKPNGDQINIIINEINKSLEIQNNGGQTERLSSQQVEVSGSFTDLSFLHRSKDIGINLIVNYKNPDDLIDYRAKITLNWAVELAAK